MLSKIHFITYGEGGEKYERAKNRIIKEAQDSNFFTSFSKYGYND